MGGYSGRCLRVELAGGKIDSFQVPEKAQRAVIGGSGLGAWLFLQRARPDVEPLSPENPLLILNGPLAGTGFPGSSRFAVCARSPLTGIWGEAAVGGNFGPALRQAGWDGIELAGAAASPRTLVIDDGKVELRDASPLWGRDTYETTRALKKELGGEFRIFCIGPAGENLVKYATIANDEAHCAGRTGIGAVMGSKRLKALAVRSLSARIGLPQKLREAGVPREALPECGEAALSDGSIVYNPRPADAASLTELLEAAW